MNKLIRQQEKADYYMQNHPTVSAGGCKREIRFIFESHKGESKVINYVVGAYGVADVWPTSKSKEGTQT